MAFGEIIGSVVGGYFLGTVLDKKWNTSPLMVAVFSLAGIVYSAWRIYRYAKSALEKESGTKE